MNLPLSFQFPQDRVDDCGNTIAAITGHKDGVISIRLMEADSVLREKARVELNEPLRSLIGHFRHEYGHYLDLATWQIRDQDESKALFGDPFSIDYEAATDRYYKEGPVNDWQMNYVSPYGSMHPWEDFAETVSLYLEIIAIWQNAEWFGWKDFSSGKDSIEVLVGESVRIACFVSECNLDMGLSILLPEVINDQVMKKLEHIHQLRELQEALVLAHAGEDQVAS